LGSETKKAFAELIMEKISEVADMEKNPPETIKEILGRKWYFKKMRELYNYFEIENNNKVEKTSYR
jgi:hypothetical protein